MQRSVRAVLALALLCACGGSSKPTTTTTTTTPAADKILVNVDDEGIGLGGNDPIEYTANKVEPGIVDHTSEYGGAKYQFLTAENKAKFDSDMPKFAPAFGGYCAFAASQNRLVESDPNVYKNQDGQLLMFANEDFRTQFEKDPAGNKKKADANWPGLVSQHGKPKG